jgi:hypothetical protein
MKKYKKQLFMIYFSYLIKKKTKEIERTRDDGNQSTSPHSYKFYILFLLRLQIKLERKKCQIRRKLSSENARTLLETRFLGAHRPSEKLVGRARGNMGQEKTRPECQ